MEKEGKSELESIARVVLGIEAYEGIKDWYVSILDKKRPYVVFVVRRCYLLALIMEKITGQKMIDGGSSVFLTDAAFFLHCKIFADYYEKWTSFPQILLVDDILIHGRNLNKLIYRMEKEIIRILKLNGGYDEEKIKDDFRDAVEIEVFTCARGTLLLWEKYKSCLNYREVMSARDWHQLSSDISALVLCSDITNACYIFSEGLSDEEFRRINNRLIEAGFVESTYQNTTEYAQVQYLGGKGNCKAIYTLRIIKNSMYPGYRVAPFVFLPALSKEETETIQRFVLEKIQKKVSSNCADWVQKLCEIEGQRSINELLSLIFSHVLLREFNRRFEISRDVASADWDYEINKLVRNYNDGSSSEVSEHLKGIVREELFVKDTLDELFNNCIPEGKYVVSGMSEEGSAQDGLKEIFESEENYFYDQGYNAEKDTCDFVKQPFLTKKDRLKEAQVKYVEKDFAKLFGNSTLEQLRNGVVCFLQLMDAGVLGLSSNASWDTAVNGYAQFIKYGEQALLIRPLQLYEYIPMLALMQKKCEQREIIIKEELSNFSGSGCCKIDLPKVQEISEFVEKLAEIHQRPEDWNGNYLPKRMPHEKDKSAVLEWIMKFREKKDDYIKQYMDYLNKKEN